MSGEVRDRREVEGGEGQRDRRSSMRGGGRGGRRGRGRGGRRRRGGSILLPTTPAVGVVVAVGVAVVVDVALVHGHEGVLENGQEEEGQAVATQFVAQSTCRWVVR